MIHCIKCRKCGGRAKISVEAVDDLIGQCQHENCSMVRVATMMRFIRVEVKCAADPALTARIEKGGGA